MQADQSLLEPRACDGGRDERGDDERAERGDDERGATVVVPATERVDSERYVAAALETARYRHENVQLRRRVAELERDLSAAERDLSAAERDLSAAERARQALVDRYERVLDGRERDRGHEPVRRLDTLAGLLRHRLASLRR